jgi:hypothetical protein
MEDLLNFSRLFQQSGWDIFPSTLTNRLIVCLPLSRKECRIFLIKHSWQLALSAARFGFSEARIYYNGGIFNIPVSPYCNVQGEPEKIMITATKNNRPNLVDATRRQVAEFIVEQREAEKIVIVTSQITNRCIDIDLISPERGIFRYASQWNGINFLELWRESLSQYEDLRTRLDSDGYIPGFVYNLLRVDGSLGQYQKDYYLANNFLSSEPVRISVANPKDWQLIRSGL